MTKKLLGVILITLSLAHAADGRQQRRKSAATVPPVAAPQVDRTKLKAQAEELARAFVSGDLGKLADMTYPRLIELIGGKTQMIASIEKDMKGMRAEGIEIDSVSVGEPGQVIRIGKQTFAVIPETLRMKVPQGLLVGQSFLIGVSEDGGERWTFVNGLSGANKERLRVLLPAAADKLNLPEMKPPVLQARP